MNILRFVFIMSSNTSNVCQLGEGYFSMKVNGESVVVNSGNDVMADTSGKPTVGPVTLQLTLW